MVHLHLYTFITVYTFGNYLHNFFQFDHFQHKIATLPKIKQFY